MATLKDLRTLVQREVMDCPSFLIDTALNVAARGFLNIARIWRATIDLPVQSSDTAWPLTAPNESEIVEVLGVAHGPGDNLLRAPSNDLLGLRTAARQRPRFFSSVDGESLELLPYPDAPYLLAVTVALRPALNSMTVADVVIRQAGQDIAAGAAANLLGQSGHPWTDLAKAELRRQEADAAAWGLWHKSQGGFVGASMKARAPSSWV